MALHKILLPDGVTELANVKSVTFKEAVNSGVDLRPGCVGSASIEVEVYGAQTNAVSVGDALTYYQIDKGGNQTLIGVFYAEPTIATKNSWKFVAYDAANKLNADFSSWLMSHQASFPMTIYALVSAACTEAGVTLGSASWTLSTENVQAFYADGITCRQILSYAAELGCKFVRCHSDGKVYFDWYTTATNKRIYPSAGTSGSETRYAYKQDGLSYANYTTAGIDGVAVHPSGEDDVAYIYPTTPTGDNLLNITNNLLLTGADAALYNAAANAIYTALNALGTYRPATARLFPMENPFRAGDVVAVTDVQGVSFTTVIMEQTVTDSDATLTSTGNEDYADSESNTQKALVQLASDIVQINKLKVGWAEIDQAIINELQANGINAVNISSSTWHSEESWDNSTTQGTASIDISGRTLYLNATSLDKDEQATNRGTITITMTDGGYPSVQFKKWTIGEVGVDSTEVGTFGVTTTGSVNSGTGVFDEVYISNVCRSNIYFNRELPALSADTTYLGTRFEDENGTGRGGLGFYYVTQYGEGIRLYTTRGGVNNGVAMFIDSNGNSSVVFGQPDAWRAGLNVSANYAAGDTISFPTTGNSYFTRFHGDWRDTKNLYFLIPTSRPCVGLTATVSGSIYLVTNGVRNSVNMSNVTPTCFCTDSGIAVRLTWSTAPSYAVQYNLASVQPYGFTVTFS